MVTARPLPAPSDAPKLASVERVIESFGGADYVCGKEVATAVYLMTQLQRPLLIEGPPGVGKTELAKVLADTTGRELIRLQCYEGLDEAKALYEWEYSKQLLYVQMLKERLGSLLADANSLNEAVAHLQNQESAFFSRHFLVAAALAPGHRVAAPDGFINRRD